MPEWISGHERIPTKPGLYFVKANGDKQLLKLNEFYRKMDISESFLWLDESDYDRKIINEIVSLKSIDEYSKYSRHEIAEKFLTPYEPLIHKSIVINTFHKYYLRIIAQLRIENSQLSKGVTNSFKFKKEVEPESRPLVKSNGLIDKIKLLNNNSFFEINENNNSK